MQQRAEGRGTGKVGGAGRETGKVGDEGREAGKAVVLVGCRRNGGCGDGTYDRRAARRLGEAGRGGEFLRGGDIGNGREWAGMSQPKLPPSI